MNYGTNEKIYTATAGSIPNTENIAFIDVEHCDKKAILVVVYQTNPAVGNASEAIWTCNKSQMKKLKKILNTTKYVLVYDRGNDYRALSEEGIDIVALKKKTIDIYHIIQKLTGESFSLKDVSKLLNIGKKTKKTHKSKNEIQEQCQNDVLLLRRLTLCLLSGELQKVMNKGSKEPSAITVECNTLNMVEAVV